MKKLTIILVIAVAAVMISADDYQLWEKTRQIAENNWNWVQGMTTTIGETVNLKSGESESSTKTIIRHSPFQDMVMNEIELSVINGEEQTKEEASQQFSEVLKRDNSPKRDGIFFENPNKKFTLKRNGKTETINGFECVGFEFSYYDAESKDIQTGTIWIESESGAPIKKVFSPKKNPRFVTDMEMTFDYYYNPETGDWYSESLDTIVNISVLGRKMRNNTVVTFSDYWRYER